MGELTVARHYQAGQSSSTHGYTSGGTTGSNSKVIDKFSFASGTQDAGNVGVLTVSRNYLTGQQY